MWGLNYRVQIWISLQDEVGPRRRKITWLVLLLGASRFGGAAVMNLGQA